MTHVNREYAEALLELAEEEGKTAEYVTALEETERELKENAGYLNLLASPAISREERMQALNDAFGSRIPLPMLIMLRLMVYRGYARNLLPMMECFRELARDRRGESVARVQSAVPLTEAEKKALQEKLEKRFGRKMILNLEVDPALLGGVRVETEGRVLDGSLRTRLQEIKEVMDS